MGKFVKIRQCDYNGSSQPARPEPVTRFSKRMRYILTSFLRPHQARLLRLEGSAKFDGLCFSSVFSRTSGRCCPTFSPCLFDPSNLLLLSLRSSAASARVAVPRDARTYIPATQLPLLFMPRDSV